MAETKIKANVINGSSKVSRLSLAEIERAGIEGLVLNAAGVNIAYSDFADDARYTDVTLYFSKYARTIVELCRLYERIAKRHYGGRFYEMGGKYNYPTVAVRVYNRWLVFSDCGFFDGGIDKNLDLRKVEFHCSDLIEVKDIFNGIN